MHPPRRPKAPGNPRAPAAPPARRTHIPFEGART
jgi:hypothetical protein